MVRLETQQVACLADVREAMPDVAGARLVQHLRLQMRDVHRLSKQAGHLLDRVTVPTANIDDVASSEGVLHGKTERARDVSHMHEVPLLLTVFKDQRRLSVQQTGTEVGKDTGIRIGKCLPWTEYVEQPQGHHFDPVGGTDDLTASLLHEFRQGVDRRQINLLRLVRWHGNERATVRRNRVPTGGGSRNASNRIVTATGTIAIEALTVDAHR